MKASDIAQAIYYLEVMKADKKIHIPDYAEFVLLIFRLKSSLMSVGIDVENDMAAPEGDDDEDDGDARYQQMKDDFATGDRL